MRQTYLFGEAAPDDEIGALIFNYFAGGGVSCGIEQALGRSPDVAINHCADAIRMHTINHPRTEHLQVNVWDVAPQRHLPLVEDVLRQTEEWLNARRRRGRALMDRTPELVVQETPHRVLIAPHVLELEDGHKVELEGIFAPMVESQALGAEREPDGHRSKDEPSFSMVLNPVPDAWEAADGALVFSPVALCRRPIAVVRWLIEQDFVFVEDDARLLVAKAQEVLRAHAALHGSLTQYEAERLVLLRRGLLR